MAAIFHIPDMGPVNRQYIVRNYFLNLHIPQPGPLPPPDMTPAVETLQRARLGALRYRIIALFFQSGMNPSMQTLVNLILGLRDDAGVLVPLDSGTLLDYYRVKRLLRVRLRDTHIVFRTLKGCMELVFVDMMHQLWVTGGVGAGGLVDLVLKYAYQCIHCIQRLEPFFRDAETISTNPALDQVSGIVGTRPNIGRQLELLDGVGLPAHPHDAMAAPPPVGPFEVVLQPLWPEGDPALINYTPNLPPI